MITATELSILQRNKKYSQTGIDAAKEYSFVSYRQTYINQLKDSTLKYIHDILLETHYNDKEIIIPIDKVFSVELPEFATDIEKELRFLFFQYRGYDDFIEEVIARIINVLTSNGYVVTLSPYVTLYNSTVTNRLNLCLSIKW